MKKNATFDIPEGQYYLCGHSLGPASKQAVASLQQGLQGWQQDKVKGWSTQFWLDLPEKLGKALAPLLGAHSDEEIVADSTSVNLLKCLLTALTINHNRKIILTENDNFPADRYIAHSLSAIDENITLKSVTAPELVDALDDSVAVLMLTHVNYRNASQHDMAMLTQKAHALGVIVVWDLSHSVGAMPLHCSLLGVDFAVGCTYKYVNGGPGSPGFIYVARKHHNQTPVIKGWMGHISPFAFAQVYQKAAGIKAYLTGTPSILSLKALEGALAVFRDVDLEQLREKSMVLSQQLIDNIDSCVPQLTLVSSRDPRARGSHVAYSHPFADKIVTDLIANGVIVDYRAPDLIRFGIAPLYIDGHDIEKAVQILVKSMC
jgi:kynureninase